MINNSMMLLVFTVEFPSVMISKGVIFEVKTHLTVSKYSYFMPIEVKDMVYSSTAVIMIISIA